MLIPPHVPWVLSKHAGAGDSAGRPALPPCPRFLSLCLPWWPTHPHCNSISQPVPFSLPVTRVATLNACAAQTEKRPSFTLLFHAFPTPSDLCLLLGLNPFDKRLCSHRCSTGSAAALDRPVVALVTQSCSTVM